MLEFPLKELADNPIGEDVAVGSYAGHIVAVSKSGKRVELFLSRGNTTQHMHVVENVSVAQESFDRAFTKWRSIRFRDYSMTLKESCFSCPGEPIFLRVESGVIANAVMQGADKLPFTRLFTVEDLFDEIQEGIDERFLAIEVEYDPDLGYPASIFFDRVEGVDDETQITVSDVIAAPEPVVD